MKSDIFVLIALSGFVLCLGSTTVSISLDLSNNLQNEQSVFFICLMIIGLVLYCTGYILGQLTLNKEYELDKKFRIAEYEVECREKLEREQKSVNAYKEYSKKLGETKS